MPFECVKTNKVHRMLAIFHVYFRGEDVDSRPAANGEPILKLQLESKGQVRLTFRFCGEPAAAYSSISKHRRFPIGFSVKAKKYTRTFAARSISLRWPYLSLFACDDSSKLRLVDILIISICIDSGGINSDITLQ